MKVAAYDPADAIPDLAGKVILVTGGTSGIGRQTVLELARHNPGHIAVLGRNAEAADKLITDTGLDSRISFIQCDMLSLASVKACVASFLAQHDRLDILIENAGINALSGPGSLTEDGYEEVWQTNYLALALMDHLLTPIMEKTASAGHDVRLVVVSSNAQASATETGIAYESLQDGSVFSGMAGGTTRYAISKLANVLRVDEFARRHPSITAVSLHPGVIMETKMMRKLPWYIKAVFPIFFTILTPVRGAYNQLWAATAPTSEVISGTYYEPVAEKGKRNPAATPEAAKKLWEWTEGELMKWG